MSRDKYYEDHEINVNGGTGTLTINGNLTISGSYEVSDIQLSSAVTQLQRYNAYSFGPSASADFANVTYTSEGFITFSSTATTLYAPVIGIPHGAILSGVRVVSTTSAANDVLSVYFYAYEVGVGANTLASVSYDGDGEKDEILTVATHTFDYSRDYNYYIKIIGDADGSGVQLKLIDIIYTIDKFPQDTGSTPS